MRTCTTYGCAASDRMQPPLALATLSTTAAAINSNFDPSALIVGPPFASVTPLLHRSRSGPALLGNKNTISITYRQPYNDLTFCPDCWLKQIAAQDQAGLSGSLRHVVVPPFCSLVSKQGAGAYLYTVPQATRNSQ
jgi:hypothetical protein